MEDKYLLLNKDRKLLSFSIEERIGSQRCIEHESFCELRPQGFTNINEWVTNRNYAKHKEHLRRWLKEWKLDTVKGFIDVTHCLGLNDCLWVKSCTSGLTWEDVNLYHNDFSDVIEYTAFEKGLQGLKIETTSPEFTSEGTFAKCWKKRDNIVLLKKGSEGFVNAGLEPYSEYYASALAARFDGVLSVRYDLEVYKGNLVTVCDMFTDEKTGFVPFYKILRDNQTQDIASVLDLCRELGFENEFRTMILIDSISFNQDRHLGNFGFLVDNETFEIKSFAPLFDFNMSLMCRAVHEDFSLGEPLRYIKEYGICHKLGGEFDKVGRQIITQDMRKTLPSPKEIYIQKHAKYNLPQERLNILNRALEENYAAIIDKPVIMRQKGK